MKFRTSNEKD